MPDCSFVHTVFGEALYAATSYTVCSRKRGGKVLHWLLFPTDQSFAPQSINFLTLLSSTCLGTKVSLQFLPFRINREALVIAAEGKQKSLGNDGHQKLLVQTSLGCTV